MRRSELCWFLVFALQLQMHMQMITLVAATRSRLLEPTNYNHGHNHHQGHVNPPGGDVLSSEFNTTSSTTTEISSPRRTSSVEKIDVGDDEYLKMNMLGSRPPNCDSKCYGCVPCEAIQVPTSTSRLNLQYANYLPEGWKCKCGPSFYSP